MLREAFDAGFRPFFLLAAANACASMLPWLYVLGGGSVTTRGWPPQSLHAHEMIYGTVAPVIAGFLLTAVPNWTATPRVRGARLAGLCALYLAGRWSLAPGSPLGSLAAACVDVAFLPALAVFIGVPIVRTRNWRNFGVVGIVLGLGLANAVIHFGVDTGDAMVLRAGTRAAVYGIVILMSIIAGRITPAFTRNALRAEGIEATVVSRRGVGATAIAFAAVAMLLDALQPQSRTAAAFAGVAFPLLLWRQSGWAFRATRGRPMLWILHLGHAWIAFGFACLALSDGFGVGIGAAALHAFTAGAMGTLILGVMPRVSLGHSGREIAANPATVVMFACVITGAAIRIVGAGGPVAWYRPSVLVGGALWTAAWAIFLFAYARILVRPAAA